MVKFKYILVSITWLTVKVITVISHAVHKKILFFLGSGLIPLFLFVHLPRHLYLRWSENCLRQPCPNHHLWGSVTTLSPVLYMLLISCSSGMIPMKVTVLHFYILFLAFCFVFCFQRKARLLSTAWILLYVSRRCLRDLFK